MKECLIDVLNGRDTLLHVFPIAVETHDGSPKAVSPEQEALELAAHLQLVPANETADLYARPHVSRSGPLSPYADVVSIKNKEREQAERRICERAYFIWQQEGYSDNRADEHWHRAHEIESSGAPG